jgi:hypothetical protein
MRALVRWRQLGGWLSAARRRDAATSLIEAGPPDRVKPTRRSQPFGGVRRWFSQPRSSRPVRRSPARAVLRRPRRSRLYSRRQLCMESSSIVTTTPKDSGQVRPSRPDPGPTGHIGWIVAGSLVTGLVVGLLLVAAPFIPAEESELTGALLCGFALGWAMLAVLSVRFSDQPQRWAAAPALFVGLGGLLLVGFGSGVHEVLSWVWPPRLVGVGGLDDRPSASAAS